MNSFGVFNLLSNEEKYGEDEKQFDVRNADWNYVELILHGLGMEKYNEKFRNLNISLDTFLNLNAEDLIAVGITEENDRKIILENLESHKSCRNDYVIAENHEDDLIIAKNVFNQVVLLYKYAAHLRSKWTNKVFIDYEGDKPYPPAKRLQIFSEAALVQCNKMINMLNGNNNGDNLIEKVLQVQNISLPKHLRKRLTKKKTSFLNAVTLIGISLVAALTIRLIFMKGRQ